MYKLNIPYTLAMRHQYLQCYLHFQKAKWTLITGINMSTSELPYLSDLVQSGSNVFRYVKIALLWKSRLLYLPSTKSVEVNGVTYKIGAVLATKPATDFDLKRFTWFSHLFTFTYKQWIHWTTHYCVHVTTTTLTFALVKLQSIASYLTLTPYSLSNFPGRLCLVPKFITPKQWIFLIMHTIIWRAHACSLKTLKVGVARNSI